MNKRNIEYQKGFLTALKIQVNNPVIDDIISNLNAYQEIALSGNYLNVHLTLDSVTYLEKNLDEIQDRILKIYPDDKEEYISRRIEKLEKITETIDEKMKRLSGMTDTTDFGFRTGEKNESKGTSEFSERAGQGTPRSLGEGGSDLHGFRRLS